MIKISELQSKEVINISDGRRLGQIHDLELDLREGVIKAIVVPGESKLFGLISGGREWVIPWGQVVKIGADVIFVRIGHRNPNNGELETRPLLMGD